jgi:hypothetical protein
MSKLYLRLTVENVGSETAVDALLEEFEKYPYIHTASISWGGMFGQTKERNYEVDRIFEDVQPRIIVQHFELKRLNKKAVRDLIKSLEGQLKEAKEQLKGLEYTTE